MLGIAKKEFHYGIVNLVKRKRLLLESESEKPVEVRMALIDEVAIEDEYAESHYMRPHWAGVGSSIDRLRIRDQPNVNGLLQEG